MSELEEAKRRTEGLNNTPIDDFELFASEIAQWVEEWDTMNEDEREAFLAGYATYEQYEAQVEGWRVRLSQRGK